MAATRSSVPEPDLVTVPVPVAIGSDTVVLPVPSNVNANDPAMAFPEATLRSNVDEPTEVTVLAAVNVMGLVIVFAPSAERSAPLPPPVPAMSIAVSAIVKPVACDNSSRAPLATDVPADVAPSAAESPATTTPAEIVVVPV